MVAISVKRMGLVKTNYQAVYQANYLYIKLWEYGKHQNLHVHVESLAETQNLMGVSRV